MGVQSHYTFDLFYAVCAFSREEDSTDRVADQFRRVFSEILEATLKQIPSDAPSGPDGCLRMMLLPR